MKTMIKMAIMTFLFKSTFSWQKAPVMSIKDICSVDLISGIDNGSFSSEMIRYIVPGGDFGIEHSIMNDKRIIQIWMPVQALEIPEHDIHVLQPFQSCIVL